MDISLPESWKGLMQAETDKLYFKALLKFLLQEYNNTCYPPHSLIFEALQCCPPTNVKVVIIGQDPYHGPGQAHGLAFSVNDGVKFPPSLKNIFKEVAADTGAEIPFSGNLTYWAQQGVLLLNSTLTVRHGKPGSHQGKGWELFTDALLTAIADLHENLVFLMWGNAAMQKTKLLDRSKHLVLESCHPSPLSANKQKWFGNHHFSKANEYLMLHGKTPIKW